MTILTIRGVKIRIHSLLLMMVGIFAVCGEIVEVAVIFGCVVLHELCHAAVASVLGYRIDMIELLPFGGVVKIDGMCDAGRKAIAVFMAGPVGSALIFLGLSEGVNHYGGIIAFAAEVNMMLALWNLVPAYPLDGGRIMNIFLRCYMSPQESLRRTVRISQIVAAVLLGYSGYCLLVKNEVLVSVILLAGMIWRWAGRESEKGGVLPFAVMAGKRRLLVKRGYLVTQWYTVHHDQRISEVIALFRPEVYTMLRVTRHDGRCMATLSETMVWRGLETHTVKEKIEKFCVREE